MNSSDVAYGDSFALDAVGPSPATPCAAIYSGSPEVLHESFTLCSSASADDILAKARGRTLFLNTYVSGGMYLLKGRCNNIDTASGKIGVGGDDWASSSWSASSAHEFVGSG
jgi:hypothetical protein